MILAIFWRVVTGPVHRLVWSNFVTGLAISFLILGLDLDLALVCHRNLYLMGSSQDPPSLGSIRNALLRKFEWVELVSGVFLSLELGIRNWIFGSHGWWSNRMGRKGTGLDWNKGTGLDWNIPVNG